MLKRLLFTLLILGVATSVYAGYKSNPYTGQFDEVPTVEEEDGTPQVYAPSTIKFTNGKVTDNADGTVSVDVSGTPLTEEQVEDYVGGMLGGTETLISVDYQDSTGDIDFVVDNDLANYSNATSAFLTSEVDGSTTNEINTLTLPDAGVTAGLGITFTQAGIMAITEPTPDTVLFTATEVDGSTTNEINTIQGDDDTPTSGLAISIDGAGIVTTDVVGDVLTITGTEVDGSITNELPIAGTYIDITGSPASTVSVDLTEAEGVTWGAGAAASIAHTFANSGTDVVMTYSTGALAVTGNISATNLSGSNTGDNTVATSGDSATDFFSSGEIADAQISDTLTSSTCTGNAATVTNGIYTTSTWSGGELAGTGLAPTIADSVAVTSWNLTTPTITTSLTTSTPTTLTAAELDRLDGLAGVIVTDTTACTEIDGTNLTITAGTLNVDNPVVADVTGNVSGSSGSCTGNSATVTVDATTTDTTSFVGLFESASGSLEPQTDATLIYNATTGSLGATDLLINGASVGTSGVGVIAIKSGTIPSSSPADEIQLYSEDVATLATGGTITTEGSYTVHTFLTSATFTPPSSGNVECLVVAGGGGGGYDYAGGGGAGGLIDNASFAVTAQAYSITVGGGGAGSVAGNAKGSNGSDSVFDTLTAVGGGGGGSSSNRAGANGGSGGGASYLESGGTATATQGYDGGGGGGATYYPSGGGGGAGAVGATPASDSSVSGNGGVGLEKSISGSAVFYAGGGGGGSNADTAGSGGNGGGGAGATGAATATAGTANTGGGGGGAGSGGGGAGATAAGGSGIVIIRYLTASAFSSVELKVRDEAGTVTTLSPHNFTNIPKEVVEQVKEDSNDLAWTYHSKKDGKEITVDMFNAIKDLENITGKQYTYINIDNEQEAVVRIAPLSEIKPARYFAEIDNNIVQRVIVAESKEWCDKLGGEWVETFIDNPQKNYASGGYIYYPDKDNFSSPQPYPSWKLDSELKWQSPIKRPLDGKIYIWNEGKLNWE